MLADEVPLHYVGEILDHSTWYMRGKKTSMKDGKDLEDHFLHSQKANVVTAPELQFLACCPAEHGVAKLLILLRHCWWDAFFCVCVGSDRDVALLSFVFGL